jgi:hypothetical protein
MAREPSRKPPPCLTFGDSSVIALRAVQTILERRHFDPFPQRSSVRALANILNKLPLGMRVGIADYISASIGRSAEDFKRIDPDGIAAWVLSGYQAERYPGLIIGAPGLAATFLAGLTGFPFLPQPYLFNARRDMRPDDALAYLEAGQELAEPLLAKHKSIEATIHFDPVHDRFLIKRVVFVRIKFIDLPNSFRVFIKRRLIPGAPVILLDCQYSWPRAEVSKRLYFQLGGLGGIAPQEYLAESEMLKSYRSRWGAPPDADWRIDRSCAEAPESEWGTVGNFLDQAGDAASEIGHRVIRIVHNHPGDLSKLVFRLYRKVWQGSQRPRNVYIAVFTHTEPRFPGVTGSLPMWLPFNTDENVDLADEILAEWRERSFINQPDGTVWMSLHPSFCSPPDLASLDTWKTMLGKYFENVNFVGVDPGRYPADLGSYVMMYPALVGIAKKNRYSGVPFRRPTTTELEEYLVGSE